MAEEHSNQRSQTFNGERTNRPSRNPRGDGERRGRRQGGRRRVDYLAVNHIDYVDYKDTELLQRFIADNGKILPRRITGTSSKNQRKIATAIKRARIMALLPFVANN
ncbi:30S ribosomal protein S18 [Oenococcus oeni]|uniref:Small ribosomal subunit protein bS18 n=2 Tax=Oenococcus oeni TaxID=1247 RepID=A0A483AYA6_OENOE|nr:30S ribosomal protein S18 [Oenococcus oeni]EAV39058.1 ribosomal protein S18 [Oenococcus oeni ATCC BAA-1163]MDN6968694.1 30S ribosomal protein S18 [Oenococcus sp. UCMA 17063]AVI93356.1 30S ribosomal protein S18 [Oenococcus oeni]EJO01368.1 SSU ribosomal protein S18P [Oenococcus oeni AWRIB418]KDP19442.1 30S ribosomal protein S18 [Oenococcus oeni]